MLYLLYLLAFVASTLALSLNVTDPDDIPQYCNPIDPGTAPISSPWSLDAFKNDPQYSLSAWTAQVPAGYFSGFTNFNTTIHYPDSYLGVYTLDNYSPDDCAAVCDQTVGCLSFNLYVVRSPTLVSCCSLSSIANIIDIND
jgi:hypothetical protein